MDDVEEIKKLKARYFRGLDTRDWDLYASVFAEDVVVDLRRAGGELWPMPEPCRWSRASTTATCRKST